MTMVANPFILPARSLGDRRPLDPTEYPAHKDLYVDVDDLGCAYQAGIDAMKAVCSNDASTRLFIVLGADGTGKSSLILRWLAWFSANLTDSHHQIINLSDELFPPHSSEWLGAAFSRILDRLGQSLAPEIHDDLRRRTNIPTAISSLADILSSQKRRVAVFVPPVETMEQVTVLSSGHKDSLLFFSESTDLSIRHSLGGQSWNTGSPLLAAETGPLRLEDGVTFVRARVKLVEGEKLQVDEGAINKMMGMRLGGTHPQITIRELQRTMAHVAENAIKSKRAVIDFDDIVNYYVPRYEER